MGGERKVAVVKKTVVVEEERKVEGKTCLPYSKKSYVCSQSMLVNIFLNLCCY